MEHVADVLLKSTIVLGTAWMVTGCMRKSPAAGRHLVWAAASAALLVLPALTIVFPQREIPVLPSFSFTAQEGTKDPVRESNASQRVSDSEAKPAVATGVSEEAPTTAGTGEFSSDRSLVAAAGTGPTSHPAVTANEGGGGWEVWAGLLWGIGCLLGLSYHMTGWLSVRRLAAGAKPVADERVRGILEHALARTGVKRHVILLAGAETAIPMTWGILRPRILLPSGYDTWSDERLTIVLLHELAHVRRWDSLTQWLAHLARAVYWPNPLAWLAVRRLRVERELASDDSVIRSGAKPSEYAGHLVGIARECRFSTAAAAAAVAMASPSRIERRVRGILSTGGNRGSLRAELILLFGVAVLLSVSVLSGLRLVRKEKGPPGQEILVNRMFTAMDDTIADAIREIGTPVDSGRENPEVFLCPSEDLLRALRPGITDGFLMSPEIEWLKDTKRRGEINMPYEMTERQEGRAGEDDWRKWTLNTIANGSYTFVQRVKGAELRLEFKGSVRLSRQSFGGLVPDARCNLSNDYDGIVPIGESLVFLGSMGEMDGHDLSGAVVWQVSAWPEEQVKYVQCVRNPEWWFRKGREGIGRMAAEAHAWVAAASGNVRGPDDKWTVTLPGGEFFRIVAIGRQLDNPMRWWDPSGNPVVPNPWWSRNTAEYWLSIVIESSGSGPGSYFQAGWEEGTPGLPNAGFAGQVLPIKKSSWEKAVEEERDLRLTVGYEVGEWKERGEIKEGEELEVDGSVYHLKEVEIRDEPRTGPIYVHVDMDYTFHPDVAVGIGVVDTDGNMTPIQNQTFVFNRPPGGREARYFSGRFVGDAEIDHLVLLTRLRDWKTFPEFALEPKGGL